MPAKLEIVNPSAESQNETPTADRFEPAQRPQSLDGKTVGLYWNVKAGGEFALARTREHIERHFSDVKFVEYLGDQGTLMRRASPDLLDSIAAQVDVAVGTTAD